LRWLRGCWRTNWNGAPWMLELASRNAGRDLSSDVVAAGWNEVSSHPMQPLALWQYWRGCRYSCLCDLGRSDACAGCRLVPVVRRLSSSDVLSAGLVMSSALMRLELGMTGAGAAPLNLSGGRGLAAIGAVSHATLKAGLLLGAFATALRYLLDTIRAHLT
jgi:hypothetical protein